MTRTFGSIYRARNETGLQLLTHTEAIVDSIIVTYQVESEFKANRQSAILEGISALKSPADMPRLGTFSDANATSLMHRSIKDVEKRARTLKYRLRRALENPALYDPLYRACQRVFHKEDELVSQSVEKPTSGSFMVAHLERGVTLQSEMLSIGSG